MKTLIAAAALVATSVLSVPQAQAATTLDCSAGPVSIGGVGQVVTLTGACSAVTVTGTGHSVTLSSASVLDVDASDTTLVTTGAVGEALLTGSGLDLTSPRVDEVTLVGADGRLRVASAGSYVLRGTGVDLKGKSAGSVELRGSSGTVRLTRLDELTIKGAGNKAVVRKGRTQVSVRGAGNVVRVHRRA